MVAKETNHHVTTTKSFLAINRVIRATTVVRDYVKVCITDLGLAKFDAALQTVCHRFNIRRVTVCLDIMSQA